MFYNSDLSYSEYKTDGKLYGTYSYGSSSNIDTTGSWNYTVSGENLFLSSLPAAPVTNQSFNIETLNSNKLTIHHVQVDAGGDKDDLWENYLK